VKELIQNDFSVFKVSEELNKILTNTVYRGLMLQGYDQVKEKIGKHHASNTTAVLIWESLNKA
jgi:lipid-A-disaccharide synthase